jgi:beta-xylosidase
MKPLPLSLHVVPKIVFPTFTGNGEDGLHLLVINDAYHWTAVDDFKSVYLQEEGLMRDPSICIGKDGEYHMTHTTEWFDHRIAVTHSDDLMNWTPTEYLYVWHDYKGVGTEESDGSSWEGDNLSKPAQRDSLVKNCWSPTIFYDDRAEEYIIYWSTSINDSRVFPESWSPDVWEDMNQKFLLYSV